MRIELPQPPTLTIKDRIWIRYLEIKERLIEPEQLSFDNVILGPRRSHVRSRYSGEIDLSSYVARGVKVALPVASAAMDTVTESDMGIVMALNGGIGVIHRFMLPERQAEEVEKVKGRTRVFEDRPLMVPVETTVGEVLEIFEKVRRGYVIVYNPREKEQADLTDDSHGPFLGMATDRDLKSAFLPNVSREDALSTSITEVMTPRDQLDTVIQGTSLEDAVTFMLGKKREKIPVVNTSGNIVGVFTIKDYEYQTKYENASRDPHGRLLAAASIGIHYSDVNRALRLVDAGVDVLFIDIAHGGLDQTSEMLYWLKVKENVSVPIVAGNVADYESILYLYYAGADGIKIGIGPGFVCKTRTQTGFGVAQMTAARRAREVLSLKRDAPPIMTDGGMREPGDIAKALAYSDSVMIGTWFAGTREAPGEIVYQEDGRRVKLVRGMASASAFEDQKLSGGTSTTSDKYIYAAEGRTTFVPVSRQEHMGPVLSGIRGSLLSSFSYTGARDMKEYHQRIRVSRVSGSAGREHERGFS